MTLPFRIAPLLWLLLAILMGVVEAATVDLVAIWFALGALVAVIPAFLGMPLWVQLTAFFLVSVIVLLATRPMAARVLHVKKVSTNADRVIGMMGKVTVPIDNVTESGRVQVDGLSWAALSDDGAPIPAGETVLVKRIDGAHVIVEQV